MTRFADTRITYTPHESLAQSLVRDIVAEYPRLVGVKIYLRDDEGNLRIVASKDAKEIGTAGGASELGALTAGQVFYGRGTDTVSVVQPLRDQNGEPIAAVRLVLKSFTGQTEQAVLQRALPIVKEMQARIHSRDELQ